jgi:hypothetical protein
MSSLCCLDEGRRDSLSLLRRIIEAWTAFQKEQRKFEKNAMILGLMLHHYRTYPNVSGIESQRVPYLNPSHRSYNDSIPETRNDYLSGVHLDFVFCYVAVPNRSYSSLRGFVPNYKTIKITGQFIIESKKSIIPLYYA